MPDRIPRTGRPMPSPQTSAAQAAPVVAMPAGAVALEGMGNILATLQRRRERDNERRTGLQTQRLSDRLEHTLAELSVNNPTEQADLFYQQSQEMLEGMSQEVPDGRHRRRFLEEGRLLTERLAGRALLAQDRAMRGQRVKEEVDLAEAGAHNLRSVEELVGTFRHKQSRWKEGVEEGEFTPDDVERLESSVRGLYRQQLGIILSNAVESGEILQQGVFEDIEQEIEDLPDDMLPRMDKQALLSKLPSLLEQARKQRQSALSEHYVDRATRIGSDPNLSPEDALRQVSALWQEVNSPIVLAESDTIERARAALSEALRDNAGMWMSESVFHADQAQQIKAMARELGVFTAAEMTQFNRSIDGLATSEMQRHVRNFQTIRLETQRSLFQGEEVPAARRAEVHRAYEALNARGLVDESAMREFETAEAVADSINKVLFQDFAQELGLHRGRLPTDMWYRADVMEALVPDHFEEEQRKAFIEGFGAWVEDAQEAIRDGAGSSLFEKTSKYRQFEREEQELRQAAASEGREVSYKALLSIRERASSWLIQQQMKVGVPESLATPFTSYQMDSLFEALESGDRDTALQELEMFHASAGRFSWTGITNMISRDDRWHRYAPVLRMSHSIGQPDNDLARDQRDLLGLVIDALNTDVESLATSEQRTDFLNFVHQYRGDLGEGSRVESNRQFLNTLVEAYSSGAVNKRAAEHTMEKVLQYMRFSPNTRFEDRDHGTAVASALSLFTSFHIPFESGGRFQLYPTHEIPEAMGWWERYKNEIADPMNRERGWATGRDNLQSLKAYSNQLSELGAIAFGDIPNIYRRPTMRAASIMQVYGQLEPQTIEPVVFGDSTNAGNFWRAAAGMDIFQEDVTFPGLRDHPTLRSVALALSTETPLDALDLNERGRLVRDIIRDHGALRWSPVHKALQVVIYPAGIAGDITDEVVADPREPVPLFRVADPETGIQEPVLIQHHDTILQRARRSQALRPSLERLLTLDIEVSPFGSSLPRTFLGNIDVYPVGTRKEVLEILSSPEKMGPGQDTWMTDMMAFILRRLDKDRQTRARMSDTPSPINHRQIMALEQGLPMDAFERRPLKHKVEEAEREEAEKEQQVKDFDQSVLRGERRTRYP